jgi:protein-S-isoprenylcysteine O-methyltransferase Ste14
VFTFLISIICYIIGLSSLVYYFFFVEFWIDSNLRPFSWESVLVNTALFLPFPLQHTTLARQSVKAQLLRYIKPELQRSFYVATSGLVIWSMLLYWRRFDPIFYQFESSLVFDVLFYSALVLIVFSTMALNHASMFGLKQGYRTWKRKEIKEEGLKTSGIYGVVRHPITSLLIVALWSHESLSAGRLLFNLLFTSYALVGTYLEERSLMDAYGEEYKSYAGRVPAFIPRLKN